MLGFLLRTFMGGMPVYALVVGGASLFLAGLAAVRVREPVPAVAPLAPSSVT